VSEPTSSQDTPAGRVDLEEVSRLVSALERDLARVQGGSQDVQTLRDEVEGLRKVLGTTGDDHEPVKTRLSSIHSLVDTLVDDAIEGARYVAEIGRMLGL
jgi:hypothetical protein